VFPALALVDLDRHLPWVPGLERPPTVGVALGLDQIDRLGHAVVGRDAGVTQMLEPPQHVVVPPRRERETGPGGAASLAISDHLAGRPATEEAALEEVIVPAPTRLGHARAAPAPRSCASRASSTQIVV
jgi:hypothetical protein